MNKFTLFLGLFFASVIFLKSSRPSQSNSAGAPVAHTGAPKPTTGNELTCTNCHGGTLNTGPNEATLTFDGDPESLMPGEQYTVTVAIPGSTASAAGFQLVSLRPDKGNCGSLTPGTTTKTVLGSGRTYVTHKNKLNKSWTFTWTAPATLPDSVFFFAAAREQTTSSKTYTTKKKFINNVTSAKSDFGNETFSLYPSFSDGRIFITVSPMLVPFGEVNVFDSKGKRVLMQTLNATDLVSTEALEINLPGDSKSGIYYCQVTSGAMRTVKPFFKN